MLRISIQPKSAKFLEHHELEQRDVLRTAPKHLFLLWIWLMCNGSYFQCSNSARKNWNLVSLYYWDHETLLYDYLLSFVGLQIKTFFFWRNIATLGSQPDVKGCGLAVPALAPERLADAMDGECTQGPFVLYLIISFIFIFFYLYLCFVWRTSTMCMYCFCIGLKFWA